MNGWRSRRVSRPAIWSTSAPVSTTASIGLSRSRPRGCSAGVVGDLRAQIGRGVEQRPALAVGGDREARLGARARRADRRPRRAADRAAAVPLRKAATGRRTEHDGGQAPHRQAGPGPVPGSKSELGRQIAVDLEADADLDEGRGGPGHDVLRERFFWQYSIYAQA